MEWTIRVNYKQIVLGDVYCLISEDENTSMVIISLDTSTVPSSAIQIHIDKVCADTCTYPVLVEHVTLYKMQQSYKY